MRATWKTLVAAVCGSLLCFASAGGSPVRVRPAAGPVRPFDGTLSLLTYNVEGVPWPFAWNRPPAFTRIADRLLALRRSGQAPQIVALQEAFTGEAQAIGREALYPY